MPNAYLIPVAENGFVPLDPTGIDVRYCVANERGTLLMGGETYATLEAAIAAVTLAGYTLPDEKT